MGNSQSEKKKIKTEVMNNTNVQMKMKKVNDTINKTTVELINKVSDSMKVDSKTVLEQKMKGISIKDVKNSSGVRIDIKQQLDQMDTVNITSIQKIEQDSQIVQDLQKQLTTDLQRSVSAQQEASKSEGEQMMKEMMGAITGAVKSAMQVLNPGGSTISDTDIETSIKNELNINSETELINKTENIMNNKMVTETLTELATSFETYLSQVVDGEISIEGVENSEDVGIALVQEAKITRDVAMKKMNDTGMGSKIMAKLLEVDETQVKEGITAAQKAEDKQQGTLEDAGEAVSTAAKGVGEGVSTGAKGIGEGVATGVGGVFQAMLGPIIIIGIVAVVGLFVVKPMLAKMDGKDINNILATAKGGKYMKGGSKKLKSLFNYLLNKLKPLYNIIKPYLTFKNANIILGLIVGYKLIRLVMKFFSKESFSDDEVNKNYYIKVNGKYLKRVDSKIELTDNKDDASLISVVKVIDNVFLKFGQELSITNLGKKLKVMKSVPIFYPSQKVNYDKSNNSLKIGDHFLNEKDGKIELSDKNGKVELEEKQ